MTKPLTVLKSAGPKLVPFLKFVAIYFVLYGTVEYATVPYTIVKCAPIVSLMAFVLMHGMHLTEYYTYSRRILIGLIFSCIGDVLLVYKEYGLFLPGMVAFAVAHVFYALAFGFHRVGYWSGSICSLLLALVYYILEPGWHGIMRIAGPIYCSVIMLMFWRAIARVKLFNNLWTWTSVVGCAGSFFFCVSDFLIGYNKFVSPIPNSHQLVMATYYVAQLGITLSVVDSQTDIALRSSRKEAARTKHLLQQTALEQSAQLSATAKAVQG